MQEYRIICKSTQGFVNAVLAATSEDIMMEINEPLREIIIPEFEAYRTGIPKLRKILKAGDVMLRSQYFSYRDDKFTIKKDIEFMSTGTSGNLRKIDIGYKNGAFLDAYIPSGRICGYKIVFQGPDRIPTIRYKSVFYSKQPIFIVGVRELIEDYHGYWQFGNQLEESKILAELLPKLVKYSP